jgi:hypothetical protein
MNIKYLFYAIALLTILTLDLFSQQEYHNWYFGKQAGITFKTQNGEPTFLSGNAITQYEGCAAISNFAGNLQLYTNGVLVITGQGKILNPPYTYLKGHQSTTQSAVIIKKPASNNIYYIFTADAAEYLDPPNEGIHYSIVDMALNGGDGALTDINIPLLNTASEKLTATPHANGQDIWVIARGFGNNNFYSWLLTKDGIVDTVITSIGFAPINTNESIGYMRVSPKGNKIVVVYQEKPFFEIYRFDNKSGTMSDRIQIPIDGYYQLYGVEFSPNGNLLYISNSRTSQDFFTVFQFDISKHDYNSILNSKYQVVNDKGNVGALMLGPNNRIYLAAVGEPHLKAIMNPNNKGPQCSFNNLAVSLRDSLSYMGLPQTFPKYNYSKNLYVCQGQNIFLDPDEFLIDTNKYQNTYKWTGPNDYESYLPKPLIQNAQVKDTGTYTLNITYNVNGEEIKISFVNKLFVIPKNNFKIIGPSYLCQGDSVTIFADTINNTFSYRWSTGSTRRTLRIGQGGYYKLYITNSFGCVDSAEITINSVPKPISKIIGSKIICNNKPIELKSEIISDTLEYLWSNGSTNPIISVIDTGIYWLKVKNKFGCIDSSAIKVRKFDNLKVKIGGNPIICSPYSTELYALIEPYDSELNYQYNWSNGANDSLVIISRPGKIKLDVVIEGNCIYSDEVNVLKYDSPILELNYKDTVYLCSGQKIILKPISIDTSLQYEWNNGNKNPEIEVSNQGKYTLKAINAAGCAVEKNVYVKFFPITKFNLVETQFTKECITDSIKLEVLPKGNGCKYKWNTGSNLPYIIVNKSGFYSVNVTNEYGCDTLLSTIVNVGDGINVTILGDKEICFGEQTKLKAAVNTVENISNFTFKWSTGDTTELILVSNPGKYWVEVKHYGGCVAYDTIEVSILEKPIVKLNFEGKLTFCRDTNINLKILEPNPNFNYIWNDGLQSTQRVINKSGKYKIYVNNKNKCFDSAEVEFEFLDFPKLVINTNKEPIICEGEEILLFIITDKELNYRWSTGGVDSLEKVYQPGYYYLKYFNDKGCMDSIGIDIIGGSAKDFEIITDKKEICQGDSAILTISEDFARYQWSTGENTKSIIVNQAGKYIVQVWDDFGCTAVKDIEISIISGELNIEIPDNLNFSNCKSTFENVIRIRNLSNFNIEIDDIIIPQNFEILNLSELKGDFNINEEKLVKFKILNQELGKKEYKIIFKVSKPCPNQFEFTIIYDYYINTEIKVENSELESGSKDCLAVFYKVLCPDGIKINTGFRFKLLIPAEYYYPESVLIGQILNMKLLGNNWELEIKGDRPLVEFSDSLLVIICGTALLGSNQKAEMKITEFNWNDFNIKTNLLNGFISSYACAINIRGIQYFKPTNLSINPNPVNDNLNINIETNSIGVHYLAIYNSEGIKIDDISFEYKLNQPSNFNYNFNTDKYSNGIYLAVLSSPYGIVNSVRFIILK